MLVACPAVGVRGDPGGPEAHAPAGALAVAVAALGHAPAEQAQVLAGAQSRLELAHRAPRGSAGRRARACAPTLGSERVPEPPSGDVEQPADRAEKLVVGGR